MKYAQSKNKEWKSLHIRRHLSNHLHTAGRKEIEYQTHTKPSEYPSEYLSRLKAV